MARTDMDNKTVPKVLGRLPVACSAAKIEPDTPTNRPAPNASDRFSEEASRPCSAGLDRVITASAVLAVARPIPRPEKIQPTATRTYGIEGRKAIITVEPSPMASATQPR